jgi:hypothetical protein
MMASLQDPGHLKNDEELVAAIVAERGSTVGSRVEELSQAGGDRHYQGAEPSVLLVGAVAHH